MRCYARCRPSAASKNAHQMTIGWVPSTASCIISTTITLRKYHSIDSAQDAVNNARTGTVWDFVKATQPVYRESVIPQSFELATAGGQKLWVHPNATKHIAEFAQMKAENYAPDAVRMATQAELTSFKAAVESAVGNGIRYDELIAVGGWELKFARLRRTGNLPVVIHARAIR